MRTYERVTFLRSGSARPRTVLLSNPQVVDGTLRGIEVRVDGEEVAPVGADRRLRIIGTDLIIRRSPMVMNLHYGTLEAG